MNLIPMGPNCGEPVSVAVLRDRIRHWILRGTAERGRDQFEFALSLMPPGKATLLLHAVPSAGLSVRVERATPTSATPCWTFDLNRIEDALPTFDAVQLVASNERPVLILTRRSPTGEDSVWIVGTEVP